MTSVLAKGTFIEIQALKTGINGDEDDLEILHRTIQNFLKMRHQRFQKMIMTFNSHYSNQDAYKAFRVYTNGLRKNMGL